MLIYRDYGYSWDEHFQRELGALTGQYIRGASQDFMQLQNRYHGPLVPFLKARMDFWAGAKTLRDAIFVDHLVNFLLFYTSVFVFFLLGRRRFHAWQPALLGCAFLVLSPVIFSQSFYNPKDIPFLAFFIFAMFTLALLDERPTLLRALLHAVFCAAVMAVRIPGAIVPVLTLGIFALRQLFAPREERLPAGRLLALLAVFLVVTTGVFILLYPVAWHDPIKELSTAFAHFQKFEDWNDRMLFMGQYITADTTPWFYLPVWIAITTPLLYTFLFLSGTARAAWRLLQRPLLLLDAGKRYRLLDLGWFFVPLVVIIAGRSVVYDTWRHVFFVYPAFILLAVGGLLGWFDWLRRRWNPRVALAAAGLACALSFGSTLVHIVTTHPYENLYFNLLAGPNLAAVKQNYELDYWGLTFRAALEYIVKNNPSNHIDVMASNRAGEFAAEMLTQSDRDRIIFVATLDKAHYLITNYKYHPQDYDLPDEVFTIRIHGVKIVSVFKLRD